MTKSQKPQATIQKPNVKGYRSDVDLVFLAEMPDESLAPLVTHLTHDPKDAEVRVTEEITTDELYKEFKPAHSVYWSLIAREIQTMGGNTFANVLRGGEGVLYREVLCDVCEKLKVNFNKNSNVERIEAAMMLKILEDSLAKMSKADLKKLAEAVGLENTEGITPEILMGSFQTAFKLGGFKSYQLTLIVVNAVLKALVGKGLTVAGNAALMQAMKVLTGPIGWAITGVWTAIDIAGPGFRVTIPAVIHVAALRQQYLYGSCAE